MSAIAPIRGQGGTRGRDMSLQRVLSRPHRGTRPSMLCLVSIEVMQEPTRKGRLRRCHFVPRQRQDGWTLSQDTRCPNPMLKVMGLGGMLTTCKICIEVQWRRFAYVFPAFCFRLIRMRDTDRNLGASSCRNCKEVTTDSIPEPAISRSDQPHKLSGADFTTRTRTVIVSSFLLAVWAHKLTNAPHVSTLAQLDPLAQVHSTLGRSCRMTLSC